MVVKPGLFAFVPHDKRYSELFAVVQERRHLCTCRFGCLFFSPCGTWLNRSVLIPLSVAKVWGDFFVLVRGGSASRERATDLGRSADRDELSSLVEQWNSAFCPYLERVNEFGGVVVHGHKRPEILRDGVERGRGIGAIEHRHEHPATYTASPSPAD